MLGTSFLAPLHYCSLVTYTCNLLSNGFAYAFQLFNHVAAVRHADDAVTGLVSAEGEQLSLPEPVALVEDVKRGGEAGVNVGVGVQQVAEASREAMKSAVHKAIEELGKETKLQ